MHKQHARNFRQLRSLADRISGLIGSGQWKQLNASLRHHLIAKLNRRFLKLKYLLPSRTLRTALGAAVVLIAMTGKAEAQIFAAPVHNAFGLGSSGYYPAPTTADIDNDGDMDVFTGDYYGNLYFFENTGTATAPAFAAGDTAAFGLPELTTVVQPRFVDIDNDGDLDLFVGTTDYYDNLLLFIENKGTATAASFAAPDTNAFGINISADFVVPEFADLDDDGDMDLLITDYYNVMYYFENTGSASSPAFAAPVTNPFGLAPCPSNYLAPHVFVDFDKDGDFDLLEADYYGDFYYYQNTGSASSPAFAAPVMNPFGLTKQVTEDGAAVAVADLDGDGDMDILAGEYYGSLYYYENITPVGVKDVAGNNADILVFPTITEQNVRIEMPDNLQRLEIIDAQGRIHDNFNCTGETSLNVDLKGNSGLYLLRFYDRSGNTTTKRVVKQ